MRFNYSLVTPESLDIIEAKECYSIGELQCARDMLAIALRNPESACMGFGTNDRLYGIAGSYRQWAGSSQLWAVFDAESERYPIALRRACLQLISYAVAKQELYRVSLTVKSEYTKGNRFAHSLGFDFEGKMLAFLPDGSDANLYARLF